MKCNPWVGGSIGRRGFPMLGNGKRGLSTYVKELFKNGEQGFFYDPNDLKTQYQDAAGTAAVNATGQPLGVVLDKSKGLVLGSERAVNGDFSNGSANWTVSGTDATHIVTFADGKVRYQSDTISPALVLYQGGAVVTGKWYEVTITCSSYVSGSLKMDVGNGAIMVVSGLGTFKTKILANTNTFVLTRNSPNVDLTIDSISVKELAGNHAYQTTSAARPILQDAPRRIDFDAVDDKLITNLPSALTNCTVLRAIPDVGAQVKYNQTLPMLYEDSNNHAGLVAINRALTRKEQLRLMEELDKKAGATSLETLTFKTFDNNQEGFIYDPNDLSTMFQDSAGNIPVTAVGQPVGLLLDKSKGLRAVPLVPSWDGTFTNGFTNMIPASNWTIVNGRAYHAFSTEALAVTLSVPIQKAGVFMEFDAEVITAKDTAQVQINKTQTTITFNFGTGRHKVYLPPGSISIQFKRNPVMSGAEFYIDNVTLHEIQGNHAFQINSASRPILRQNTVTGANYLEFDGVDDFLVTSSFPSMGAATTIFAGSRSNKGSTAAVVGRGTTGYVYQISSQVAVQSVLNPVMVGQSGNTVITAKYAASGTGVTLKANNVSSTNPNTVDRGFANTNPLAIGAFGSNGAVPLLGHIYALIGIAKVVSDDESAAIEKELAKRTGVTLNV